MENKSLTLELSLEEINKIMTALGNLPYIQVNQIINKIQQQVGRQMAPDIEKIVNQSKEMAE
ncbi:MAG: hypothetical protein AAFN93_02815 [Bacteroidota bacterium]